MPEIIVMNLTLPALERMIGGDAELAVGLRRGICAEFAKRHLNGLINEEVQSAIGEFRAEVRDIARKSVREALSDMASIRVGDYYHVDEDLLKSLNEDVKSQVKHTIRDTVIEAVHANYDKLTQLAKATAQKTVDTIVAEELKSLVKAKLETAIKTL